jgi:hypothetical protein
MGLEAVTQAEQDAEEAGGQSAQQKGRSCRVPVHGERQDQPGGQQGMHDVLQERSTKHVGARFDALRGEDESKATIEEGPVLAAGQQRTFASICTSDPAARSPPDEEAQVHIAEGRSKARIQRQ